METLLGLIGTIGAIFMLLAYFLLVIGHIKVTDGHHIMLNVLGALLIVVALHMGLTVPIFLTLVVWLLISLFGLYKNHIAVSN